MVTQSQSISLLVRGNRQQGPVTAFRYWLTIGIETPLRFMPPRANAKMPRWVNRRGALSGGTGRKLQARRPTGPRGSFKGLQDLACDRPDHALLSPSPA